MINLCLKALNPIGTTLSWNFHYMLCPFLKWSTRQCAHIWSYNLQILTQAIWGLYEIRPSKLLMYIIQLPCKYHHWGFSRRSFRETFGNYLREKYHRQVTQDTNDRHDRSVRLDRQDRQGRVMVPKQMNFRKNSKLSLTPPPHFRKIMLQFFIIDSKP